MVLMLDNRSKVHLTLWPLDIVACEKTCEGSKTSGQSVQSDQSQTSQNELESAIDVDIASQVSPVSTGQTD